eukprot:s22_g51.t1
MAPDIPLAAADVGAGLVPVELLCFEAATVCDEARFPPGCPWRALGLAARRAKGTELGSGAAALVEGDHGSTAAGAEG